MTTYPSLLKIIKCTNCNCERHKFTYTESVSAYEMYQMGLINLQYILEKNLTDKLLVCPNCDKKTAESKYELINCYLAIDLEFLHEERIPKFFNVL